MRTLARLACLLPLALTPGCLFAHVRTPLDTDLTVTTLGNKVGESTARSILWLVAWGDAGTAAAAANGGLTTLRQMDAEVLVVLFGLYTEETTIVYGD
jgi:TRL-like protein family